MLQGLQISSCEMEFTKARLLKLPPQVEEPLAKTTGKKTRQSCASLEFRFILFVQKNP